MKLRGLYAITPECADEGTLLARARAALAGGAALLQYRNKRAPRIRRLREACALAQLCRSSGVPLVINDDARLAVEAGADGAHLGREDGDAAEARKLLAGRILGVSCYDSLERARAAVAAGADYVAFGSVFASPTKPAAARVPLSLFSRARALGVPLAAIGGITLAEAPRVIAVGADLLAVISDLFDAADIEEQARAYARLFAHEVAQ
jgi:thiamine-phosphate pyrophosphorylase